ncbi:MAG: amino acid ABC transporter substrate-binding protein [Desulfobacter sp.]|nr:MAG: amino acid ABC transporter substrate-binding protein [Desulfobacter sp.]
MTINRMAGVLVIVLALGLFSPHQSDSREFVIGTDPWPPFTITKNGMFSGIDVDLCREIEKKLPGVSFRFKKIPWVRALHFMEIGKIDAITGLAKRKEREVYILYTAPPYYSKCSSEFYLKKGNGSWIKTYDDLYRYKIGYVVNSAYFSPFDNDEKLNKQGVTHELQLLRMLNSGRLEVIIGTNCQVDHHIKIGGFQGNFEKAAYKPNNTVDLYLGLSKKSDITNLASQLNRVIRELKKEGVIEKIAQKYFN